VGHFNILQGWCREREKIDWQEAGKFDCRLMRTIGWCREREKIDWQEPPKFDCRLVRTIFIFCCFARQDIGEWPKNQILIPDWTYFHYPGTTLIGEWPENQILIPDWTYLHCPSTTLIS